MAGSGPNSGLHLPGLAATRHGEGIALMQQGRFGEGLPLLRFALETEPGNGQYWLSYAHGLLISGNPPAALHIIQQAIDGGLNAPAALRLKQDALAALAREPLRPAEPAAPEFDRLEAMLRAGRHAEAEAHATALLNRHPGSGYLWSILGHSRLSQQKEAIEALQTASSLLRDDAQVHNLLGVALHKAGRTSEALQALRTAVQIDPRHFESHNNLGNVLRDIGDVDAAVQNYRHAISIDAGFAQAHNNLGNALRDLGRLDEAVASIRTALQINPGHATAHNNLGMLLMDLGRYRDCLACFSTALSIKPDYFEAFSNLLFAQNLLPDGSAQDALAAARKYGHLVTPKPVPPSAAVVNSDPDRRLRIGLVSGDLRSHPVGYFLESTLKAISAGGQDGLEFHVYSNHWLEDSLTERLKPYCAGWYRAAGVPDSALVERIRRDAIDILVDLSGHTANNRLPLFALKPAPVQVSWLGYFATTGVPAIDYLIADPLTLPTAEEVNFTETIWRLPQTRLSFTPPDIDIGVSELPALRNGYITFGCFNSLSKMNADVVSLWSRVLLNISGSRLFLKCKQLRENSVYEDVIRRFDAHGVEAHRLILEGSEPRAGYLAAYHRVDIALDPFPYPGGATTAEALWMGVPVLTMAGHRFLSRQGAGLLLNAGLEAWVAVDADDYFQRAASHSSDRVALASLRQHLRDQVLASPVFDGKLLADHLSAALRAMWKVQVASGSGD